MLQMWILPDEENPPNKQVSICGNCPIRKACYVQWGQAPTAVWRATYPDFWESPYLLNYVRLGASGDPAAIPTWAWADMEEYLGDCTGYTHAWREARHLRHYCMASTESWHDTFDAWVDGWRTFRVIPDGDRERLIPVMEQWCSAMFGTQCISCMDCDGGVFASKKSIVIPAHGSGKGNF